MHHCDVLCLILSSLCSLPAYNYAEHLVDAPCLCTFLCCYCYSFFLFVCFVGLYARHPYIHLILFEIYLLAMACLCIISISPPTHFTRAPPTPAKKRCLSLATAD